MWNHTNNATSIYKNNTIKRNILLDAINPLNAELNPIYHLLALLGGATIVVVSRLRVKDNIEMLSTMHFMKTKH
jgi:hypothetical protein